MTAKINAEAQAVIDRIKAIDWRRPPVVDTARLQRAFDQHLAALGLAPRPVVVVEQGTKAAILLVFSRAEAAYRAAEAPEKKKAAAWDAARDAAWDAAWAAAFLNCYSSGERPAAVDVWVKASAPLLEVLEAGADLYWIGEREIFVSMRPSIVVDARERLHSANGPAVQWTAPDGERYYFWHGVRVPEHVVATPEKITVREIEGEVNAEVRRVMIERFGSARYLQESGAVFVNRDRYGELYRKAIRDDEDLVMVKVKNSTPEPDGSIKDYFLRVPPAMRTAHEAVAWTFGLTPETYNPRVET